MDAAVSNSVGLINYSICNMYINGENETDNTSIGWPGRFCQHYGDDTKQELWRILMDRSQLVLVSIGKLYA